MKNQQITIQLKPAEIKAAEAIAKKEGLRTVNQWIVTVVLRALILK